MKKGILVVLPGRKWWQLGARWWQLVQRGLRCRCKGKRGMEECGIGGAPAVPAGATDWGMQEKEPI